MVDKSEKEVMDICQTLSLEEVRQHSYANLLYKEVRSGYVHEYRPGNRADSSPMTGNPNVQVSYVNWANQDRRIYFQKPMGPGLDT